MYYFLYNPLSSNKDTSQKVEALCKKMSKENETHLVNIMEISGKENEFLQQRQPEEIVVLCGGDGTVNTFINRIDTDLIKCKLYLYTCGTGNDFAREYKKHFFEITEQVKTSPRLRINGETNYRFVNGAGIGVDAVVCRNKTQYKMSRIKKSYLSISISALKTFRTYSADIELDDNKYHYDNVWFIISNHGKYFGGGMKVTPKAVRDDEYLDVCIVHKASFATLLFLFPFIYIGLHTLFKKYVTIVRAKKVKIVPNGCYTLQHDGEVLENVKLVEVER